MQVSVPLSQINTFHELSVGELRDWYESHPTLLAFPFKDIDTELKEKIMTFEHWFDLYLRDRAYCINQEVEHLASKYQCSRVMVWIWMNSEYIKDHEVADYIKQAGELFHKKNESCVLLDADQCKTNIGVIAKGILFSFAALARPRALEALMVCQREFVSPAQVLHDNGALYVDSSDDELGTGAQALPGSGSGQSF